MVVLLAGPLGGTAGADNVRIWVSGGNWVIGEVTTYDVGAYDYWQDPWVGEFQGPLPWNTICASQGYRDLRMENTGPNWFYYEGVYSGFKASCVFVERYVTFADRYTGEEWDWRFAWRSNHTHNPAYNDFVEVGVIDA